MATKSVKPQPVRYAGDVHIVHQPKPVGWPKGEPYCGWQVAVVHFRKTDVVGTYRTQREAANVGRQYAKIRGCELTVHAKKTGRFRAKESFGRDPRGVNG